ncbi:hypothetical protein LVJ94_33795 [Pendulispora rubella]|uniref:Uncharacterized protein n=1 Tax=Pendulispora rubella TaxID=2741070 RepID=A0ABZ2KT54_9BACT
MRTDALGALFLFVTLGFPTGCSSRPDPESIGVDACDGYIIVYQDCLRRMGVSGRPLYARLGAARTSMMVAASTGEAARAALQVRCIEATNQLAQSCP